MKTRCPHCGCEFYAPPPTHRRRAETYMVSAPCGHLVRIPWPPDAMWDFGSLESWDTLIFGLTAGVGLLVILVMFELIFPR